MKKILLILILIPSLVFGSTVLDRAKIYLPLLSNIFEEYWNDYQYKHLIAGQIEQESSWKPKAHLHTKREDGYGFGQITVTPRFNTFEIATKFKPLKDWNWQNDQYNEKFQLTYVVLQDKMNFKQMQKLFINDEEASKAMLVCYNAGMGRVLKRRQFAIASDMKYDIWTNGLELSHDFSENKIIYNKPLWEMVNEYPKFVFKKAEKYKDLI